MKVEQNQCDEASTVDTAQYDEASTVDTAQFDEASTVDTAQCDEASTVVSAQCHEASTVDTALNARILSNLNAEETTTKTKCQRSRERRLKLQQTRSHTFVPKCKKNGKYKRVQCHHVTGHCWCVSNSGAKVPGTKVRSGKPVCRKGQHWSYYYWWV